MPKRVKPISDTDAIRLYVMKNVRSSAGYTFRAFAPAGVDIPEKIIWGEEGPKLLKFLKTAAKATLERRSRVKK